MSASCSQRLLSLWLRRLSTDRIAKLRDKSREVSAPLVVYGKRGNAELIVAVDEAAERLGLHAGLALAQARAMHPALQAIEEDAEADAVLLEKIADWCLRYTPLVAVDAPDGLLLDISGCAHLYGGEEALVADLAARLEQAGFAYTIAIAGSIGAARAAAHFGEPARYAMRRGARFARAAAAGRAAASRRDRRGAGARRPRNASAISSICRAAPSPPASAADLLRQLDRALGTSTSRSIRACRSRPMSPSSALPSRSRARRTCWRSSCGWRRGCNSRWSGAATAPAASSSLYSAPTARCAASPPAPRARCAIRRRSARCSSSGSPRSPTNSTPASASTWRGCR